MEPIIEICEKLLKRCEEFPAYYSTQWDNYHICTICEALKDAHEVLVSLNAYAEKDDATRDFVHALTYQWLRRWGGK